MRMVGKQVGSLALIAMLVAAAFVGMVRGASAQDADAQIRVIHASPDAPAVDIWVNGSVAIESLEFGNATDWIALPAGSYDVAVTPAGADADSAVIEGTFDLEGGVYYNVAAVGFLDAIEAQVYVTDIAGLAEGQARVTVIHASPDAPAVDVAVAGGPVLIEGLEFPDSSGALDVDGGTYDLEVRVAGTEDVALDLPGVALEAGTVYDILAIGTLEEGTLTVLPLTTAAAAAADSGDSEGVGGTTSVPATGVGSAVQSAGMMGWVLLGVAIMLATLGGALTLAPSRRK